MKQWRKANKDKIKDYNKNYTKLSAEANKDKDAKRKKEWAEANKEKIKKAGNFFYVSNKEKILLKQKTWYTSNKEKVSKYSKINKNKIKARVKKHREANKQKVLQREKLYREKNRIKINAKRKLLLNNPLNKLTKTIRNSILQSFKRNGYTKKSRTYEILGCSFIEFKHHLESKFESWMNWENHGKYNSELDYGWDVDHIIPLASATCEADIIKLSHYTNLQPLCSRVNRDIKKNNIV